MRKRTIGDRSGNITALLAAAAGAAVALLGPAARAAVTQTWTGNVSGNWQDANNWTTAVPTAADTAAFTSTSSNTTVVLGSTATAATVSFGGSAAAYTLGSTAAGDTAFTLAPLGTISMGSIANDETFAVPVSVSGVGTTTITNSSTTNALDFAGGLTGNSGTATKDTTLSFTGAGATNISGTSTLGNATATNGVLFNVNGGNVTLLSGANVSVWSNNGVTSAISSSGSLTIASGAALTTSKAISVAGLLTINGNYTQSAGDFPIPAGGSIVQNSGTVTLAGNLSPASGTAASSYALKGGTLALGQQSFNTGTNFTFQFNGGTLKLNRNSTTTLPLANPNGWQVWAGGGTIDTINGTVIFNQGLVEPAGSTGGGLTKVSAGTLVLNGTNTYTGTNQVNAGLLLVGDSTHTSASIASGVSVNNTGKLAGFGVIQKGVTVKVGGTISAGSNTAAATGAATGLLTIDNSSAPATLTMNGGTTASTSSLALKFNNATGAAGTTSGWDEIATDAFSVGTSGGSLVAVKLISTTSTGASGAMQNFSSLNSANAPGTVIDFPVAEITGGSTSFSLSNFFLDSATLATFASLNGASPSQFGLALDPTAGASQLDVTYTVPVPEPGAALGVAVLGLPWLSRRRRRSVNSQRASS